MKSKILGPRLVHERGELGDAWFSRSRAYRYLLTRGEAGPRITFVMLNPSTADHDRNDPTITRCIGFARRLGGREHRVAIVNLYALRATDPDVLFAHARAVGGAVNDRVIVEQARASQLVIAAWGADRRSAKRAGEVRQMLAEARVTLHRIGPPSKHGAPRHPLYLRGDLRLEAA